jgi:SAM-dependent methyltransferase
MPDRSYSEIQAALAQVLPPELVGLFDDRFIQSSERLEEYVFRLALAVFRASGLEHACAEPADVDEAVARAGLAPEAARVPAMWFLRLLTTRGHLTQYADGRFRTNAALPPLDPEEWVLEQARQDARCLPSFRIAALAAAAYPAVLRGAISGEDTLFAPDHMDAWIQYFSNDNPLYAIANSVGAFAAERALPGGSATVLELGGGLGSGTAALLTHLKSSGPPDRLAAYRFTEIVPAFLRRAKKTLSAQFPAAPLTFAWLDQNHSFAKAGVAAGSCELVYAVNALHVAHDLAATLAEARNTLAPGGSLVISECVRPFAGRPLHVEFVFNLLGAFRAPQLVPAWRPNGGFLTPEQWTAALEANGFSDVTIFPDIAALRDAFPSFTVAAITARRP